MNRIYIDGLSAHGGLALEESEYPEPTVEEPDDEQIEEWIFDSLCDATDGCTVEPDGVCPHGHPSWLIRLGLV